MKNVAVVSNARDIGIHNILRSILHRPRSYLHNQPANADKVSRNLVEFTGCRLVSGSSRFGRPPTRERLGRWGPLLFVRRDIHTPPQKGHGVSAKDIHTLQVYLTKFFKSKYAIQ